MGESNTSADEDLLLKEFFAEVSEVERDNEVVRILSCFKLNPFQLLKLSFDSSTKDVRKQYRKLSLMVHPDKCKHPQAKEAFGALAKAQQQLLDQQERDYILSQVTAAKEEVRANRKKQLKKDTASKLKSLVDEGKSEREYEQSEEFLQELKLKVRELLTEQEWRRRKMAMRISEEEGRLKKDEEEQKEMWKRKREHEEQWEGTREQRVSSWRDFMKSGKKVCVILVKSCPSFKDEQQMIHNSLWYSFMKTKEVIVLRPTVWFVCLRSKKGEVRPPKLKTGSKQVVCSKAYKAGLILVFLLLI